MPPAGAADTGSCNLSGNGIQRCLLCIDCIDGLGSQTGGIFMIIMPVSMGAVRGSHFMIGLNALHHFLSPGVVYMVTPVMSVCTLVFAC